MMVIGASWGRTGTTSAAAALERLGFGPCLHMQTMWRQPELAEQLAAYYRDEPGGSPSPQRLRGLVEQFGSTVDWPPSIRLNRQSG